MQKQGLGGRRGIKSCVFGQLFTKALPEKKMLDSRGRVLVELPVLNGEDYVL